MYKFCVLLATYSIRLHLVLLLWFISFQVLIWEKILYFPVLLNHTSSHQGEKKFVWVSYLCKWVCEVPLLKIDNINSRFRLLQCSYFTFYSYLGWSAQTEWYEIISAFHWSHRTSDSLSQLCQGQSLLYNDFNKLMWVLGKKTNLNSYGLGFQRYNPPHIHGGWKTAWKACEGSAWGAQGKK